MFVPRRPALAKDRAMLVGDPVAFIVAESVDLAKDAAERIAVEYEPLPVRHRNGTGAVTPGAPKLWAECRDNECFFFTLGDQRAVEAAFAQAASRQPPQARLQPRHRRHDGAARLHRRLG